MRIVSAVISEMRSAFWGRSAESGGILGMRDGVVCRFVFDVGLANAGEYIPDTDRLNAVLAQWHREGIVFCGMVHTHLGGCRRPSGADIQSMRSIYRAMKKDCLYFPIVTFDGEVMDSAIYRMDADGVCEEALDTV